MAIGNLATGVAFCSVAGHKGHCVEMEKMVTARKFAEDTAVEVETFCRLLSSSAHASVDFELGPRRC